MKCSSQARIERRGMHSAAEASHMPCTSFQIALCSTWLLLALLGGCSRPSSPSGSTLASGQACRADVDCPSELCDRGRCATPAELDPSRAAGGTFGHACDPRYETGKLAVCGAYRCIEDRCRSCINDEECAPGGRANGVFCDNGQCNRYPPLPPEPIAAPPPPPSGRP